MWNIFPKQRKYCYLQQPSYTHYYVCVLISCWRYLPQLHQASKAYRQNVTQPKNCGANVCIIMSTRVLKFQLFIYIHMFIYAPLQWSRSPEPTSTRRMKRESIEQPILYVDTAQTWLHCNNGAYKDAFHKNYSKTPTHCRGTRRPSHTCRRGRADQSLAPC